MDRTELLLTLNISQATFYRLLKEGLPSEDNKRTVFDLEKVVEWRNNRDSSKVCSLVVGQEYTNEEIAESFKCATKGSIRKSHTSKAIVIFSDHTGESVFEDFWLNNKLHYNGVGEGNQTISKGENKLLANSTKDKVKVYLFETFYDDLHTFTGEVILVDDPYTFTEKDSTGVNRIVYKFPLKIVNEDILLDDQKFVDARDLLEEKVNKLTFDELEILAKDSSERNKTVNKLNENKKAYRFLLKKKYANNAYVAAYVKEKSNGICELCEKQAPFMEDGIPYLELFYIESLEHGGSVTIENSVAVCPNCKARLIELDDESDYKKLLAKIKDRNLKTK